MCGIVGYVGDKSAIDIVLDGLKRLEYRGYDSAGAAVIGPAGLQIRRAAGRIKVLEGLLREKPMEGRIGLGHTRWATHGRPTDENAHPHTDGSGDLVVVHNGIIENYLPIKERLQAEGHVFTSETDTEVIAHLIERHLQDTPRLDEAVRRALRELRGSYAIVVLHRRMPDRLVAAKLGAGSVVFTKMDECVSLGCLYNLSRKLQAPLSYLCNGQNIPDDIALARPRNVVEAVLAMRQETAAMESH